jgi:plasmid maintenance system antidote protein VapI
MQVHEKVKEYIDEHFLKQTAIARAAGMSVSTFNAMINGKRKMYAEDLMAICKVLNVSANFFINAESASKN